MPSKILICAVAASVATAVIGYPQRYTNRNEGCFIQTGAATAMTGPDNRNADAAAGLTMTFTPALVDGSYSPNQAYSVTFDGANGLTMVGSSAGAWSNPPGSTAACTANGQTGFYHQDNAAQVGGFVATWTAPGNGSVTIGGSRAAGYGPTNTQQMTLNPPGQTSRPTPAPTQAPVPASTGTFDPNLCTDTALWSVYDTAAFPDVKMCFRKIGSTDFEFAMQSPAGFYAALGISSSETGMNDLDVYSFLASSKTVQTRYADAKSKPAIEDTAGYADILTLASQSGLEQVVFRRPQAASGNRKDLTGTADYVLLGAYGETSGSPEDMNQHIRKSASSGAVSMAEAGLIGANVAKFSSGSKMAHGAMMVFAWVFLCPTAIFDARAAKGVLGPLWFQLHRAMQTLAVLLTIIGIIIISTDDTVKITAESPEASQTHSNIGYTVLAFSIFQVLLGYTRNLISQHDAKHKDPDHPHGPRRWLFNYAHYATGLVLVILSLLNVFSGLWLGCPDENPSEDCVDGIGWVKAPVKDFYYAGVIFAIIAYVGIASLQLLKKYGVVESASLVDTVGRHLFALVTAMSLSAAITITTIVADSDHM